MSMPEIAASQSSGKPTRRALWWIRELTLGVLCSSTFGAFSAWHQLLDLCSHFRFQYLVLLSVAAVLLWRCKSTRWALLAAAGAIHNAALIVPYYVPLQKPGDSAARLSLVSFNVHTTNRQTADVLEYLQRKNPDVILLIEVDQRWIRELAPLKETYSYTALSPQADNFGIAVYSKLPIAEQVIAPLGPKQPLSIWVELELDGHRIGLLGTHPWPPMTPWMFRNRNEQLSAAAAKVQSAGLPTILAGDFNATPWCNGFHAVQHAGLQDSALGFGLQRTWNAKLPLLWIPIDHVLTTKEFVTLRRSVGPNCGSDHYAVEAELGLR